MLPCVANSCSSENCSNKYAVKVEAQHALLHFLGGNTLSLKISRHWHPPRSPSLFPCLYPSSSFSLSVSPILSLWLRLPLLTTRFYSSDKPHKIGSEIHLTAIANKIKHLKFFKKSSCPIFSQNPYVPLVSWLVRFGWLVGLFKTGLNYDMEFS